MEPSDENLVRLELAEAELKREEEAVGELSLTPWMCGLETVSHKNLRFIESIPRSTIVCHVLFILRSTLPYHDCCTADGLNFSQRDFNPQSYARTVRDGEIFKQDEMLKQSFKGLRSYCTD